MNRLLLVLLAGCCLLSGCWDQRLLEQMEVAFGVGYDARPGGRALIVYLTPAPGGTKGKPAAKIYTVVAGSTREAREKARLVSTGRLEAGKVQYLFFGEDFARRGVLQFLDIYERDTFNPELARLVVVEGTALDFARKTTRLPNLPLPGFYIKQILDRGAAVRIIPEINVDRFFVRYYAPGLDPMLPMLRITPQGVQVLGTALFRDARMVGRLDTRETFLLQCLLGKGDDNTQIYPAPRSPGRRPYRLAVKYVATKPKFYLVRGGSIPGIAYELSLRGLIEEYYPGGIVDTGTVARLERYTAAAVRGQLDDLWHKLRATRSDPLGIGSYIRAYHPAYWRKHAWREVYPRVEAGFRVRVHLENYGVMR